MLIAMICGIGVACATSDVPDLTIENSLNSSIGKVFSDYTKLPRSMFNRISETSTIDELEYRTPSGCSYALKINKRTDVIESWRYTSLPALCQTRIFRGSR